MKLPTSLASCLTSGVLALSAATAANASTAPAVTITVQTGHPGTPISPLLYGVFYEDVNYAADGGLHAEMVQNRSFEYYPVKTWGSEGKSLNDQVPLFAWVPVQRRGLKAKLETAIHAPLHPDNPTYVVVTTTGESGLAGLANTGYDDGMPVKAQASYDFSFHARHLGGQAGPWTIALEAPDGAILARAAVPALGKTWAKQEGTLTCARSEPKARLVLTTTARGQAALDMISLFPRDTFKGRRNGLRRDLAQALADLKPTTLRFPGGCIVHGMGLANAYRWKESIGDVAHRRPNFNLWGYHQTNGLGYFEYFQFCEDIGAAPLPVLPCGVSCGFRKPFQAANDNETGEWIQDVLDLIEFANGPVATRWGRVRAELGHPAPFGLKYLGLGNEEHDTTSFRALFPRFVKAVRAKHPEIVIAGTSGLGERIPLFDLMQTCGVDITDEHYYPAPEWFIENRHRFDRLPRGNPRVYIGEYGAKNASSGNSLFAALAEAVYLTGVERNADQVVMTAYAPLLGRYGSSVSRRVLIWFDAERVVLTPNYHVQRLFSTNVGDRNLPSTTTFADSGSASTQAPPVLGVSASRVTPDGTLFLKIVNPTDRPLDARVVLEGLAVGRLTGERILMTGAGDAINNLAEPNRVAPTATPLAVNSRFATSVPAMSLQVLRLSASRR